MTNRTQSLFAGAVFGVALGALALPAQAFTSGQVVHRSSGGKCFAIEVEVSSDDSGLNLTGQELWFAITPLANQGAGSNPDQVLGAFIVAVPGSAVSFLAGVNPNPAGCTPQGNPTNYTAAGISQ